MAEARYGIMSSVMGEMDSSNRSIHTSDIKIYFFIKMEPGNVKSVFHESREIKQKSEDVKRERNELREILSHDTVEY